MKDIIRKRMPIILGVMLSISSICIIPTNSQAKAKPKPKSMYVTATAYTDRCEGCSGITAIGINLRKNPYKKVIAVDKRIIPLNSIVYVNGYGLAIAGDTGGAIKGKKIDVFIRSKKQALQWGRKTVKITIQSYSK
ncbi:3D domain-containing protein [Rummeliibacillus stabekisii]|uniref:3D domain-containing protein n=1 Tax=Rummeliibacillus stabekisii TaxID=241244 RepID=UPI0032E7FB54